MYIIYMVNMKNWKIKTERHKEVSWKKTTQKDIKRKKGNGNKRKTTGQEKWEEKQRDQERNGKEKNREGKTIKT